MTFCIITHVVHKEYENQFYGYAPYVREMNIWLKYTNKLIVVAPLTTAKPEVIDLAYNHQEIKFLKVKEFDITSLKNIFRSLLAIPKIAFQIYKAMQQADHIHLRCPGNMGLLGALIQIVFPKKKKTAKYAGNWDPNAQQPLSYRIQKWIVSNTFLTKNMQVLVYGEWEKQTKNIKPFFTATFSQNEIMPINSKNLENKIKFLFAGTLFDGKRPLYAIQLVEALHKIKPNIQIELCGEGYLRTSLEQYISQNQLESFVSLNGNLSKEAMLQAYQQSHFLILASKSEGWPKVVAEAMFWGCVPLATNISCVNSMLDNENRGVILTMNLEKDVQKVMNVLNNPDRYNQKSQKAVTWSQKYTLERFESEIKALL